MPKNRQASPRDARREAELAALRDTELAELDAMIARLLSRPMNERTHFLRRRLPGGGSAL